MKPKGKVRQFGVRLDEELHAALEQFAQKNQETLSETVRRVLRERLLAEKIIK